ncbi:MAG: lipase family protein [Aquabacterium sp.]
MLPYDATRDALYRPQLRAPLLRDDAQAPSDTALAAECARLAYLQAESDPTQAATLQAALASQGFGELQSFNVPHTHSQGFAALRARDGLALVALRGSQADVRDWAQNTRFVMLQARDGLWPGRVHTGFVQAAASLQQPIQAWLDRTAAQRLSLLFCGHSLGGALATLMPVLMQGADVPQRVLTFGSPRVGDAAFVHALAQRPGLVLQRAVHATDLVCEVPPQALHYVHAGDRLYIDRRGLVRPAASDGDIAADRLQAQIDYALAYQWRPGTPWLRGLADHAPINYVRAFWP